MYKVSWDPQTGGVILHSHVIPDTLGITPRPVFWEELDLLKLNELGWTYPHCEAPLMWACNKQYFYRGTFVFDVKGANIYDPAIVTFSKDVQPMELVPVDVAEMLRRNKDFLFLLESEAIEFIRDTYLQYVSANRSTERVAANRLDYNALLEKAEKRTKKKMAIVKEDCDSFDIVPLEMAQDSGKRIYHTTKIDRFLASFSGGKDSQVVLDLCTRAIPSTDFEVIYSDTGYELPTSLTLYEQVQKHYTELYPDLKFSIARNHESVLNYWDQIGTPSDTHRWCCSVMKTAPLYRMLKVEGTNKQARVLTFDGVRAEESQKRGSYERIGRGVKHNNVINARPIIHWNAVEIFLYIFKQKLPINVAYRLGKARVGCIICPFSSEWDDHIVNFEWTNELKPFIDRISQWSKQAGVKDTDVYIKERKWKFRASGKFMKEQTSVLVLKQHPDIEMKIVNPRMDFFDWLPSLCEFSYVEENGFRIGELKYKGTLYKFELSSKINNQYIIKVFNVTDLALSGLLKRIAYKSAYCINCEACEVECPTGALRIYPNLEIDKTKCSHCLRCLNSHDKGCIVANSINMTTSTLTKAKAGIDKYNTFGFHHEWLSEYLSYPEGFWNENSLGVKQVASLKNWLKEAEIVDNKLNITHFGEIIKDLFGSASDVAWELIWINLYKNSFIVRWFVDTIKPYQHFDKSTLSEMLAEQYSNYGRRTVDNTVAALFQTFKYSPIGEMLKNACMQDDKKFIRMPNENASDIGVAYAIYTYAEAINGRILRVSDFYGNENTSMQALGILKKDLEKALRRLNEYQEDVLSSELNMGLDHITLRDDITSVDLLKLLVK